MQQRNYRCFDTFVLPIYFHYTCSCIMGLAKKIGEANNVCFMAI